MQALCDQDDRILKEPALTIAVSELGDNSVNFAVRAWVKSEDYWPVYKLFEEELERLRSRRKRLNKTLSHIPSFQKSCTLNDVH